MRTEWLLNDDFLEICWLAWESGNELAPMQKGGGQIMCGHQFCQKGRLKTENTGFQTTFASLSRFNHQAISSHITW